LLGPSGCGKTTLLRLIGGFETPQAGTIDIDGDRVAGGGQWIPPEKRNVGMVFQDYALFPHLNVHKNIAFGLNHAKRQGNLPSPNKKRVAEVLSLVGLEGMAKRYPHELSGGQQQRVALARALAPYPAMVLLDEPLSNLDAQVRLRLRQEVRGILKNTQTSAIFVTHDREEALSVCDRVALMRQGHVEQLGTPEEIYSYPASRFVAEFVTQANFLPAIRKGEVWETEVGCFPLNEGSTEVDTADLMVRQEDLVLTPQENASVTIRDRQFLGREHRYCLQTPSGKELHARLAAKNKLPIGSQVALQVNPEAIQVFPR
jgi:iron(III) transport system ATP-binding protein